jgi:zinc protease
VDVQLLTALLALGPTAHALEIPHERYQLDNGLDVILHQDDALPQVVINLWYDVGSKEEVAGRSGFAHLFEHLMFMGTTRLPGSGFDDRMEAHGGWNNAWTSEDATDYYEVGPSNLTPTFLWMEADRMDGLDGAMTQEKLDLQRDVVRNERRQSGEDTPYGVAWLEMPTMLFPADHPYGHSVIGTHEDLQAATVGDVVGFFNQWYVPNNAGLVVAGNFDPDEIKPLIEQYFGGLERVDLPERTAPPQPDKPVKALVELTDQVQVDKTHMLWHTAPALTAGDAAMDVLSSLLTSGRSSRLYRKLLVDQALVQEVDAYQMSQQYGSVFLVEALPTDGHTVEEVEEAVAAELTLLATEGPTEDELLRVKNQLNVGFLQSLEALQSRASALNRYRVLTGDPDWVDEDLARYEAVSIDDVKAAAASLNTDRRGILRVRPEPKPAGEEQ